MPFLINKKTKKRTFFFPDEIPAKLASGEFFPDDPTERITLINTRTGDPFSVPIGDSVSAIQQRAGAVETDEQRTARLEREAERRRREERFSGTGQRILAGIEGAARGLTLGLSDLALTNRTFRGLAGLGTIENALAQRGVDVDSEIAEGLLPASRTSPERLPLVRLVVPYFPLCSPSVAAWVCKPLPVEPLARW